MALGPRSRLSRALCRKAAHVSPGIGVGNELVAVEALDDADEVERNLEGAVGGAIAGGETVLLGGLAFGAGGTLKKTCSMTFIKSSLNRISGPCI